MTFLPFDFTALQHALLVEKLGSFRHAAQSLGIRPSVISRRVRRFEDEIGVSLFNRTSKGIQTTIAGRQILAQAREILIAISTLKRSAELSGRGEHGCLRLGIVASIATGFARNLLARFKAANPALEFAVVEGPVGELIASVRSLNLDFAFVTGSASAPGCEVEGLWHERVFVALPDAHPLAAASGIAWEQLAQERFIVSRVNLGPETQDYIMRALAEMERRPDVEQISVQRETLLGLVALSQGLSLASESAAGVIYPGVVFRPLNYDELLFSIVWSTQNDNPVFRRFLMAARSEAARHQADRMVPPKTQTSEHAQTLGQPP